MTQLFGLTVLSIMGITLAFMVMTMASGLESRAQSDLGIGSEVSMASSEATVETTGQLTLSELYSIH
ncbi:MAG: hypothetical protein H8E48_02435 [Chloroflexi bacterium]|nr:hypothetical protein [Chloroflexota bacterium]